MNEVGGQAADRREQPGPHERRRGAAPVRVALATRSAHKAAEIRDILGAVPGVELVALHEIGLRPDPVEDEIERFETFEENALAKASYFAARTRLPSLADDSGLVVEALDGAPGVRTKRLAARPDLRGRELDEANNAKLLELMRGVAQPARTAYYVCAAALAFPDGRPPLVVRGTCQGQILETARGAGGFGYDPLFFVPELGHTFAEIPSSEKHERSHRGRAFRAIARHLQWLTLDCNDDGLDVDGSFG